MSRARRNYEFSNSILLRRPEKRNSILNRVVEIFLYSPLAFAPSPWYNGVAMEDVKKNIVNNLILLRKANKMTQQELAKALNYSDKAISRWEVGESLPDISVLLRVCEIYGVDFDWLIHRHDDAPKANKKNRGLGPRIAIVMLLATFCYAFATIVFVYNSVIHKDTVWLAYIWAVPASLSFAVFFSRRWWSGIVTLILVSLDMWSILAGFYLHFLATVDENVWPIFLLGVPVQIIFILFEYIRRRNARL